MLMDFRSYMTPKEVKQAFMPREWKIIKDSRRLIEQRGTREGTVRYSAGSYCHLGIGGRLELKFFNNKLVEVEYFPDDFEKYKHALETLYKITFGYKDEVDGFERAFKPRTKILAFYRRKAIRWEDTGALGKEYWNWAISQYH